MKKIVILFCLIIQINNIRANDDVYMPGPISKSIDKMFSKNKQLCGDNFRKNYNNVLDDLCGALACLVSQAYVKPKKNNFNNDKLFVEMIYTSFSMDIFYLSKKILTERTKNASIALNTCKRRFMTLVAMYPISEKPLFSEQLFMTLILSEAYKLKKLNSRANCKSFGSLLLIS